MERKFKKKFSNNVAGMICFIIAFLLSTLLIFVIELWIVLIINVSEMVFFRIVYRKSTSFSCFETEWGFPVLYIAMCCLSIGIMVLVMYCPEKICGGVLQHISDPEYVEKYFGKGYVNADTSAIIKEFRRKYGFTLLIFLIRYIVCSIGLFNNLHEGNGASVAYNLSVPLVSLGGLIILNFPWFFWLIPTKITYSYISIAYGAIIDIVQFILYCKSGKGDGKGDNSSDGETYHVIIYKD